MTPRQGMDRPLSIEAFQSSTGVSRETLTRLRAFHDHLVKWQKAINLVAGGSLRDFWRRHVLDSAQLLDLAPDNAQVWVDLGSGAGFPGLVLAILGAPEMHLVESDQRKCAFLLEAARITETRVTVHNARIEALEPLVADVITARALAPVPKLLDLASRHAGAGTVALFPKGEGVDKELLDIELKLTDPTKYRKLEIERIPSRADDKSTILRIKGLVPS